MADDGPAAACPAACPAASSSPPPLFDRIGGMRALINAVDVFYARILADPTLAPFFEGVEMSRQRTKQVSFFFLSIFRFFVFRQPPFFFFSHDLSLLLLLLLLLLLQKKKKKKSPGPVPLLRLWRPRAVPGQVDRRGARAPDPRARRPPRPLLDRGAASEREPGAAAGPRGADRGVHREHRPCGVGVPGAGGCAGARAGARAGGGDSCGGEWEKEFLLLGGGLSGVEKLEKKKKRKETHSLSFLSFSFLKQKKNQNRSSRGRGQKREPLHLLPRRWGREAKGRDNRTWQATEREELLTPPPPSPPPPPPSPPPPSLFFSFRNSHDSPSPSLPTVHLPSSSSSPFLRTKYSSSPAFILIFKL